MITWTGQYYEEFDDQMSDAFIREVLPKVLPKAKAAFDRLDGEGNPWMLIAYLIAKEYAPPMRVARPKHRPAAATEDKRNTEIRRIARVAHHMSEKGCGVGKACREVGVSEGSFGRACRANKPVWETLKDRPELAALFLEIPSIKSARN